MNYGSIGGLSLLEADKYAFFLKKEVYSAFGISDASKLYGLYYPCPKDENDERYKKATLKHDFIFTPIPPELWKASARIHLLLSNEPHTLSKLSEYLKRQNISIVHSESTRSSFRYSTWSLHIVFQKVLEMGELNYDSEIRCYKQTKIAFDDFIKDFRSDKEQKDFLFFDLPSLQPINGNPNYTLAFFAHNVSSPAERYRLFTLKVSDPGKTHRRRYMVGDEAFTKIIKTLDPQIIPATTFSEIDTRELNLRTTLIGEDDLKRFFKVAISYKGKVKTAFEKKADTYVGILHKITAELPEYYTIWHSFDRTIDNAPTESGEIVFLIEDLMRFNHNKTGHYNSDLSEEDRIKASTYRNKADEIFTAILNRNNNDDLGVRFDAPVIYSLPAPEVTKEIIIEEAKGFEYEYDLFISYSHHNKAFVEKKLKPVLRKYNIEFFLDQERIESGENVLNVLMEGIKSSREMCVLVSEKSFDSEWMAVERGAACILNRKITALLINENAIVPSILQPTKNRKAYEKKELMEFAKDIVNRRNKYLGKNFSKIYFK